MSIRLRNVVTTHWKEPIIEDKSNIAFYIGQKEICPDTKKEHWHLYIEFKDKTSMEKIKKLFNDDTIHIESRKGNQKEAINYVTKTESRAPDSVQLLYGKQKKQGNRSDLDGIHESIMEGSTAKEILLEHGGRALRFINHIKTSLEIIHIGCKVDDEILKTRETFNKMVGRERMTKVPIIK